MQIGYKTLFAEEHSHAHSSPLSNPMRVTPWAALSMLVTGTIGKQTVHQVMCMYRTCAKNWTT